MPSNIAVLTKSHTIVASKKRQKREQVKEILFDDDARRFREFLTGFHKRKLAKKEEGRKKAQEREKQERLEARREQRRMLAEKAAENAARVEEAYGGLARDGEDEEWAGIGSSSKPAREAEAEYSDEEQMATVTVVEDFDPDVLIHGAPREPDVNPYSSPDARAKEKAKAKEDDVKDVGRKPKSTPAKKIRYEGKAARVREKTKQRARRTEKAERAGGKASRKKGDHKKRR
ncbi:hypothetical protein BV25DRAFT_1899214 [Artomyces pyxidatus]|uniref:Uncharacterized protein n=1 Tax=Artomyces pyxidatus TaxID=48021 RepID=A0ACB8T557_9AGAM|nr:hypothetical protein BV25DRAFT_1899214 [Artomyces pyxidatus]